MENNRRNGKIARLPKTVRDLVSQMLEDGATYDAIIQKLNDLGYSNFNQVNIHNWKIGGLRDWQFQQIRPIREQNIALSKDPHPNSTGLMSMHLATEHFCRTLMDFDYNCLRRDLNKHPENYFRILRSFNQLIENRVRLENLIQSKAEAKAWKEFWAREQQEEKPKPRPQPRNKAIPEPQPSADDQETKPIDDLSKDQAAA